MWPRANFVPRLTSKPCTLPHSESSLLASKQTLSYAPQQTSAALPGNLCSPCGLLTCVVHEHATLVNSCTFSCDATCMWSYLCSAGCFDCCVTCTTTQLNCFVFSSTSRASCRLTLETCGSQQWQTLVATFTPNSVDLAITSKSLQTAVFAVQHIFSVHQKRFSVLQ